MRFSEFAVIEDDDTKAKEPSALLVKSILQYIQTGNWQAAIALGAVALAPRLDPYLTTDQKRVLHYAVNTYGAVNFWSGLSTFAARIGVPFLALAGWSSKLNQGEEEELRRIRARQAEWEFTP